MAFNGFAGIERDLNRIRLFVIMKITGAFHKGNVFEVRYNG